MAIPQFSVTLTPVNVMTITNNSASPMWIYVYKLDDLGTGWDSIQILPNSPLQPDLSLPATGVFQMILADNLYKIFVSDAILTTIDPINDIGYYILADHNIKSCKRDLLLSNLCGDNFGCNAIAEKKYIEKRLRFHDLEMGLYYIYSNWIMKQAMTMLIVPTNQELLSMREYLDMLLDLCGCSSDSCKQCENYVSISNWKNVDISDCGCGNTSQSTTQL